MAERSVGQGNFLTNWTDKIVQLENNSTFMTDKGLFRSYFVDTPSITLDVVKGTQQILPFSSRTRRESTGNGSDDFTTHTFSTGYVYHTDKVTKNDFLGKRQYGNNGSMAMTLMEKKVEVMERMKRNISLTKELLQLEAVQGRAIDPRDGTVLYNYYDEFDETETTIYFNLGNQAEDIDAKVAQVKDAYQRNARTGGTINGKPLLIVGRQFFNAFINHTNVRSAYLNSGSNTQYQRDLSQYFTWGITDSFEYRGVVFMVYDYDFDLLNGTTRKSAPVNGGYILPEISGENVLRAYYGPSQKLEIDGGAELFMFEYKDPYGYEYMFEAEFAPLFMNTKPGATIKVDGGVAP